jgi:hypothetical protein
LALASSVRDGTDDEIRHASVWLSRGIGDHDDVSRDH